MKAIHKVNIHELDELSQLVMAPYKYDAQVSTSVDGGQTFWHCGVGKYCKTLEEAEAYKQKIESEEVA